MAAAAAVLTIWNVNKFTEIHKSVSIRWLEYGGPMSAILFHNLFQERINAIPYRNTDHIFASETLFVAPSAYTISLFNRKTTAQAYEYDVHHVAPWMNDTSSVDRILCVCVWCVSVE